MRLEGRKWSTLRFRDGSFAAESEQDQAQKSQKNCFRILPKLFSSPKGDAFPLRKWGAIVANLYLLEYNPSGQVCVSIFGQVAPAYSKYRIGRNAQIVAIKH